jgi:ferric-dicitrate binding protein FerR (iron transport regulator)
MRDTARAVVRFDDRRQHGDAAVAGLIRDRPCRSRCDRRQEMELRRLRTDHDHTQALAEIERLWDSVPGTPDYDRLEMLERLVDAYEDQCWPIDPGPVADIDFDCVL